MSEDLDILDPTIEEMRPRLLTLDQARERFSATEPLSEHKFEAGSGVMFRIGEGWDISATTAEDTDQVHAFARMPGIDQEVQLSRGALLEAVAKSGMHKVLAERTPHHLLEPWLNWWYQGNGGWEGREFKMFVRGASGPDTVPLAVGFSNGTIRPFSNLRILDELVEGIGRAYPSAGEDILVDYKFFHSLELTHCRLVVPGYVRSIDGPGTASPSDEWSTGIQWQNSQLGVRPLSLNGYLFRWRCTNGMTAEVSESGTYNRREGQGDEVYEWASAAVDEILGGLEHSLDGVQETTAIPVSGDVGLVMDDVFQQHRVPAADQQRAIRVMAETGGDLSMYSVLNAVTQAANDAEVPPVRVARLLSTGGHVARAAHDRCEACRRLMPA